MSVEFLQITTSCELTTLVQLSGGAEIVTLLLVESFQMNVPARSVDNARFALTLPFLDLAVNSLPMLRGAVLLETPLLETALVLSLAVTS